MNRSPGGWIFVLVVFAGCDGSSATEPLSEEEFLGSCAGHYLCTSTKDPQTMVDLARTPEGACAMNDTLLISGGTITQQGKPLPDLSWRPVPGGFEMIGTGVGVVTCHVPPEVAPPIDPSKGECQGSASSCYQRASCSDQRGCHMGIHVKWNGSLEDECKGSPWPCSQFRDSQSCNRQSGCSWKKL